MFNLSVYLFGRFRVECNGRSVGGLDSGKTQELLSYLLIHRDRPHAREVLGALLWGDVQTDKSKKNLRQTLWHLQAGLKLQDAKEEDRVLTVEDQWVQLNTNSQVWVDVALLEEGFITLKDKPGWSLTVGEKELLQSAALVYKGDLLEGCYQDWCLYERERLQNIYLGVLYKLMNYCEGHSEYEEGQLYGSLILKYDRASERTHRRLMQMQYMAGDRTAALRQYDRCVLALDRDLGVKPDKRTVALYEEIRSSGPETGGKTWSVPETEVIPMPLRLSEVVGRLQEMQITLADVQRGVSQNIKDIERALADGK